MVLKGASGAFPGTLPLDRGPLRALLLCEAEDDDGDHGRWTAPGRGDHSHCPETAQTLTVGFGSRREGQ